MAGIPPVHDREWTLAHPHWRDSFVQVRANILRQQVADRDAGRVMQLGGERVDLTRLTLWDLEELADKRARRALERTINRRGDPIEIGRGL